MKKIFTIIAILLASILIPFSFVGCESNKSASQVAATYSQLQEDYFEFFDPTTRAFQVKFNASKITSSMNVASSNISSLGKVYLPMLNTSMAFFNSQAKTLKNSLEKFTQSEINEVYNGLKDFEDALEIFATSKKTFESINSATGAGFPSFIFSMQSLIDAAQRLNIAFFNGYYNNIYAKQETFKNFASKEIEVMGNKLYVAYILNNRYTRHYVWSSTNDINSFIANNAYLNISVAILKNTTTSAYDQSDEHVLTSLKENHDTFVIDLHHTIKNMNKLPYKEILKGSMMVEDLEQKLQDSYYQVENFMQAKFLPIYNAVDYLSK